MREGQNTRGSQRLALRVPVRIEWSIQNHEYHECLASDTAKMVVSAHGALVRLSWEVPLGYELKVENLATRQQQDGTVAYVEVLKNREADIGVNFSQPNPNF